MVIFFDSIAECRSFTKIYFFYEDPIGEKRGNGLPSNDLKIIQRICLELYCQYEQSLSIRDLEHISNTAYYEIVCKYVQL